MIGILDLRMGNLTSVSNAVYEMGEEPLWINNLEQLDEVSHLILPGVGHYSNASKNLNVIGAVTELSAILTERKIPVLGVCLGMQLLLDGSDEGEGQGLGIIPGRCKLLEAEHIRLPHVGWNQVVVLKDHPVLEDIKPDRDFYFVHSYALTPVDESWVVAKSMHGEIFSSIIAKDNFIGMQFHPEKSQTNGLRIIENFCNWDGEW